MEIEDKKEESDRDDLYEESWDSESENKLYNSMVKGNVKKKTILLYILGFIISFLSLGLIYISYYHYFAMFGNILLIIGSIFKLGGDIKDNEIRIRGKNKRTFGVSKGVGGVLKFTYILILALGALFLSIRIINLWKEPAVTKFPDTGEPKEGGAQVSYASNHRASEVDFSHVITVPREYNNNGLSTFFHVSLPSMFFGFIDDMFIEVVSGPLLASSFSIQVQSKLRIGRSDLGVNPLRVAKMHRGIYESANEEHLLAIALNYKGVGEVLL